MKVLSAFWTRDELGYGYLHAQIEHKGKVYPTTIDDEQKMLHRNLPLVFLGDEWEERIPAVSIIDGYGKRQRFTGFTRNPALVRLTRKFLLLVNQEDSIPGKLV